MKTKKVLVADDEDSIRTILKNSLEQQGYEVECARDGREATRFLRDSSYDLALLDIRMPGKDGFELLEQARREGRSVPIILMTAQDTMKNAVDAMKKGAFDYLVKPFDIDELEVMVKKALRESELEAEVETLRQEIREGQRGSHPLIGKSRPIREIHKTIGRLAASDFTVLLLGDSGTGKELIARAIHYESGRAAFPFLAVNVAAIPRDLLESELFGHVRGAFTGASDDRMGYFEKAGRGTLFLDEIGELPLPLQAKLLRVLQENEIQRVGAPEGRKMEARVIAATNQSLERMVKEKKFRQDLFYRLNVFPLEVPPLRMRREDIPLLVDFFLGKFCEELAIPMKSVPSEILKAFQKYPWPGNVRELENVIKRAILLCPGRTILPEVVLPFLDDNLNQVDLDDIALEEIVRKKLSSFLAKWDGYDMDNLYEVVLQRVERPLIELILEKTKANQIRASKILGINRNTLRKKIQELKIDSKAGGKK